MYEILHEFFEICMFQIILRRYGFKIHVTLNSRLWVRFFQQRKSYVKEKEKRKKNTNLLRRYLGKEIS